MQVEPLIPRRRFLKIGLALGITSVAAPLGVYRYFFNVKKHYATPFGTLLVLNKRQAEILDAACRVILPQNKLGEQVYKDVVKRLDEELFFVEKKIQTDFKLALDSLQFMPLLFSELAFFTHLPESKQQKIFKDAMGSSTDLIRVVANNIRALLFIVFYGLEVSWPAISYDGSYSDLPALNGEQRIFYAETTARHSYE